MTVSETVTGAAETVIVSGATGDAVAVTVTVLAAPASPLPAAQEASALTVTVVVAVARASTTLEELLVALRPAEEEGAW